jgi:hypothetical protein
VDLAFVGRAVVFVFETVFGCVLKVGVSEITGFFSTTGAGVTTFSTAGVSTTGVDEIV